MHPSLQDISRSDIKRLVLDFDALVFLALIWFMIQYLRFVFPPLFETLQLEYALSNTEVGFIYSVLLSGYASMQFPGGYLSDRFDEWSVITGGVVVFSIGLLLVFVSVPFWSLVIAAGLIGMGTGVHKIVSINLIHRLYAERTGLSIGVMDSVGIFGGVFAPLTVVLVLDLAINWRSIFLGGFVICAALAYGFYAVSREYTADSSPGDGESSESGEKLSYITIFKHYHFSAFVVVSTTFVFAWTGITAFFPLYLSTVGSFSGGVAGLLYGLLFSLSLSQALTGGLSDRYDRVTMTLVLYVCMTLSILAFVSSSGLIAVILSTAMLGLAFHGFRPIREAYLVEIIPNEVGGGVLGLVRTVMTIVGAISPIAMGAAADAFGLVYAFAILSGVTTLGVIVIITMLFVPMPDREVLAA